MKYSAVLLGAVLLISGTIDAQTISKLSQLSLPAAPAATAASPPALAGPAAPLQLWATTALPAEARAPDAAPTPVASLPVSSDPDPAQLPEVYGVYQNFDWQLYVGYTFFSFHEIPNLTNLENGLDIGVTFYPGKGWIGAEGNLMATFGSQAGCTSKFAFPAGGVRFRFAGPRAVEFWAHGLVGGAHFLPQTAYGGQNAFGYEAGGGIDIKAHHQRMAYRAEIDAVGTRFFHTYQISPKVSLGIVFKF